MKSMLAALALVALTASPGWAQSAAEVITDAAAKAAAKAATDTVNKAAGVTPAEENGKKAKKDKKGPNHGNSAEHRMDDEKKGHGKDRKK